MTNVTLQTIHREITEIKNTLEYLKHLMKEKKENYELSDWAKKELAAARKIPDAKLISHEEVMKKILGR